MGLAMLLRHIHYFLAVAEHLSFTRAAAALHVSQPALSQQIKQLEERLGAPLFDRSGRAIRLTDAGEVYARFARLALKDLEAGERAIHDVGDLSEGSLRLAITPTFTAYLVGPLVADFHARYPGITLSVSEMSQERMEELINEDRIDVGIAFDEVHSAELEATELLAETLTLGVGRAHPLAGQARLALDRLDAQPMILLDDEFATRERIDRYCRQHGVYPRVVMEANSISAVVEIVRRTRLATLLPEPIVRRHDDLRALALAPASLCRTAVLLQRRGAYRTAAARAFVALALEHARAEASSPPD